MTKKNSQKLVSIVIRTRNEERWIESCLKNVLRQSYKNFEIILVDNMSNDNTLKIIKEYPVKLYKIKKFFPGKALNIGISKSKGDIIVCLSGHCIPKNENWLKKLVSNLKNNKVGAVYGRQEPLPFTSNNDKRDLINTFRLERIIQKKDPFFHNANSAFNKSLWKKLKFNETVTNIEDRIWGLQLIKNKYQIIYEPNASVYHWHGINHDGNKTRLNNIIKILENNNDFFNYSKSVSVKKHKIVAIIPIKGDSIYFKNKNLLDETIKSLKKIKLIKKIFVASDSSNNKIIAKTNGVHFIKRPVILSEKHIGIIEVARFVLDKAKLDLSDYNTTCIVQVNYPFRTTETMQNIISKYFKSKFDSIIPFKKETRFSWKENKEINHDALNFLAPNKIMDTSTNINLMGIFFIGNSEKIFYDYYGNFNLGYFEIKNELESVELNK